MPVARGGESSWSRVPENSDGLVAPALHGVSGVRTSAIDFTTCWIRKMVRL